MLVVCDDILVKLTYPKKLADEARHHKEASGGHQHLSMTVEGDTLEQRLKNAQTRIRVAQNFTIGMVDAVEGSRDRLPGRRLPLSICP